MAVSEASGEEQRVVGPFLEPDDDLVLGEGDVAHGVDEVPKDVARLGGGVAVADLGAE